MKNTLKEAEIWLSNVASRENAQAIFDLKSSI